jgi:Tol biopolymer transport system component
MLIRTDANAFAFAPDGGRIALVVARSTARGASEIRIVDWESRRERVLLRERGVIDRLDWSADGKLIFYGLLSHTPGGDAVTSVRCVPAAGGAAETVLERVVYLGLAPDGSYLLYRRLDDDAATTVVQAMPLTDGPSLRIELPAGFDAPVWSSSATGLLQVRYSAGGAEIWEIPLRPRG